MYKITWRNHAGEVVDISTYPDWTALCEALGDQSGWHEYQLNYGHSFLIEKV